MTWVIIAVLVLLGVVSLFRLRRGGSGPAVNWVPRGLRGKTNDFYQKRGWEAPYDDAGNKRLSRTRM